MSATSTLRAPDIVPFSEEHLDGAAVLLAERHRAHRLVEPGLDQRYEEPDLAREEVGALVRADGASGVAGLVDGQVAGFLVGTPRDASWGPNMWVEPAGPRRRRRRARAGPLRSGRGTLGRRRPHPALRDAAGFRRRARRRVVPARLRPSAGLRDPGDAVRGRAPRRAAGPDRPPCPPRGPGRARAARRRAACAPGALAGLLAPTVADRRGRPSRVRDRLRRPEIHDLRRRAGRRGDRLCDRLRDRDVVRSQEPRASAGRGLPRLRLGAPGGAGLRRRAACSARRCSTGRARPGANGSSPTGA